MSKLDEETKIIAKKQTAKTEIPPLGLEYESP